MTFYYRKSQMKEDCCCNQKELETLFGFKLIHSLKFENWKTEQKVLKGCQKALKKHWILKEEKWLGTCFEKACAMGSLPNLAIRFVSSQLGFGLFTKQPIPPWTFLGEYYGVIRQKKLLFEKINDYCFVYPKRWYGLYHFTIDSEKQGNIFRFANHSETPNLESLAVFFENSFHIVIRSTRAIAAEEELTYDYGDLYWKKRKKLPH